MPWELGHQKKRMAWMTRDSNDDHGNAVNHGGASDGGNHGDGCDGDGNGDCATADGGCGDEGCHNHGSGDETMMMVKTMVVEMVAVVMEFEDNGGDRGHGGNGCSHSRGGSDDNVGGGVSWDSGSSSNGGDDEGGDSSDGRNGNRSLAVVMVAMAVVMVAMAVAVTEVVVMY